MDLGAARERARVARALGSLPRLADALARGELSYAKVRAVTRVATPETEERRVSTQPRATTVRLDIPRSAVDNLGVLRTFHRTRDRRHRRATCIRPLGT